MPDKRRSGSEVHPRVTHTMYLRQSVFNASRARGASHPLDNELSALPSRLVIHRRSVDSHKAMILARSGSPIGGCSRTLG